MLFINKQLLQRRPEKQLRIYRFVSHTRYTAASVLMYSFNCPQLTVIASYLIAINSMIHSEAKCSTSIITGTQISAWNMTQYETRVFVVVHN